jgi:uncharacterized protein (DUF488 family)
MKLFTIGFTQKTAEEFFSLLRDAGVRQVIDTRLNNRSQLAGFSKGDDLPFFLDRIGQISYRHVLEMAPTQELLDSYKKQKGSWARYEKEYLELVHRRDLSTRVERAELADACLLCSEHEPTHCHRRLLAEYFRAAHPDIEIVHLV